MKIKPTELESYLIALDSLELPGNGRIMKFASMKQFLTEAELAEQPVFIIKEVLYFFSDADIATCDIKKGDEKYLNTWNKKMVKNANKKLKQKNISKKK